MYIPLTTAVGVLPVRNMKRGIIFQHCCVYISTVTIFRSNSASLIYKKGCGARGGCREHGEPARQANLGHGSLPGAARPCPQTAAGEGRS